MRRCPFSLTLQVQFLSQHFSIVSGLRYCLIHYNLEPTTDSCAHSHCFSAEECNSYNHTNSISSPSSKELTSRHSLPFTSTANASQ
jgi:hypothetical protein